MKRTLFFQYPKDKNLINRLKTCFDMACIKYVIFEDYFNYTIYVDKNKCTWQQVIKEINRIKATKYTYTTGERIEEYNSKNYVFVTC